MDYIHFNPVKHGLVAELGIGNIRRFGGVWRQGCTRRIGMGRGVMRLIAGSANESMGVAARCGGECGLLALAC